MYELSTFDQIEALVSPPTADLLRARHAVRLDSTIQALFDQAATEAWDTERLTEALREGLSRYFGEVVTTEVPLYLAQEFQARDKTKTLLVSSLTGVAVAEVEPDAIYQPEPVAREGSDTLAVPLPRLKPEVEAAIIQAHNTRDSEGRVVQQMQERQRSTALQAAEGDRRLRILTRGGRKSLAEQLRQELPELLHDPSGLAGRLLGRCEVNQTVPESYALALDLTLHAWAATSVADPLAHNFRHDVFRTSREQIRAGWTRMLGRAIAGLAHNGGALAVDTASLLPNGLLIADPNVAIMTRHLDTLVVPGTLAAILDGAPYLTVSDDTYLLDAYERYAKWHVQAEVEVTLHVDPSFLHPLIFTDIVESGISVEVV